MEKLKKLGVDVDEALDRMLKNEKLYTRMLAKFPKILDEMPVLELLRKGDFNEAVTNAHTLKGATGNLSLTPLFEGYTKIVDCLRNGDNDTALKTMEDMLDIQQKIVECIKEAE
jgi:HPt (histidine-containing phosphotransfer) domain-containing protein